MRSVLLHSTLVALTLIGSTAPAATYHVDATRGDDRSPGTSADQPFKTLARAARASKPGDTVLVGPGAYDERVGIGGFPEATQRTVFRADPLGKAVLAGKEKQLRFSIRRPRVSIVGFACKDSREHAIDFQEPAHDGLVAQCVLSDNKLDGVFFRRCKGGRVESTVCARNGRHGIWFLDNHGGVAVNNTLFRNEAAGISADKSPGVVAFNNILAHNGAGLRLSGEAIGSTRSDHNLFEGGFIGEVHGPDWLFGARAGTLADWQELSGQDAHSVQGDPLVADEQSAVKPPFGIRSPAFRRGLRAERFAGFEAPTIDVNGRPVGPNTAPGVGATWHNEEGAARPIAQVDVPFDGQVSLAIVDAKGQLLRTILAGYPAARGKLDVCWDGKDDLGRDAPPAQYAWRAIVHNVRGVDDGSVGDTGKPPYGKTQVSDGVCDIACDARGDLYEMSFWDEAGHGLRKLEADGSADWVIPFYIRNRAGGLGTAVATDGRYVFGALARQRKHPKGNRQVRDDVRRLLAADGRPANFPAKEGQKPDNLIVVNDWKPKPWVHAQRYSDHDARAMFGIRGLAVDATRLYVSNYFAGRVEVYDKETGAKASQFPVDRPLGITAAPDGSLWLACEGSKVARFATDGKRTAEITGLADPYGVAIGGPKRHLYVTEMKAGCVREYAPDATGPRLVRTLGRAAKGPGPVKPDVFRFSGYGGLAVDAQGRISVCDKGNHRVQRFRPDGSLWQSHYSDFVSAPFVDLRQPDVLLSGTRQYRVSHVTGQWQFTHNWRPADGRFTTGKVLRRTLPNGRDYLFHLGGHRMGIVIYAIEDEGLRRSAMLGGRWMGVDDLGKGGCAGMYCWRDANANGAVEEAEMVWAKKPGKSYAYIALGPGWWVQENGDLWLADQVTKSILRLGLLGVDRHGNPRYDWTKRQTIVPEDTGPWKFHPKNLRVAPDGDLYVQGTTAQNRELRWFWMGGTAVARYARDGARRWLRPLPRVAVALSADGDYWYTGEGPTAKISMYSADGLYICSMAPGKPSGYQSGWIDHALGIFAFVHPGTKRRHVYAEEDLFGKIVRYRIDGLPKLRRLRGTFAWPTRQ